MNYRREIDGLRAVAVLPVILFHAGLGVFSGGFVGVDVFFVISGYLITTLLLEDIDKKRFSLLRFYERRARRILPVLYVVLIVVSLLGFILLPKPGLTSLLDSLQATTLFVSNFYFWTQAGYFESNALTTPLLHTWSLAVEEQYYLLFPLLLLASRRFGHQNVFGLILLLIGVSLTISELISRSDPSTNFYLPHTRMWELLVGAACAYLLVLREIRGRDFLALPGLIAICYSIFTYNEEIPFPGLHAILPVLGSALVVVYARAGTLASAILGSKPLVALGLISYSAYLWHQPVFAYTRVVTLDNSLSHSAVALGVSGTLILAALSWRFIERPFRLIGKGNSAGDKPKNLILLGGFLICLGLGSVSSNPPVMAWNDISNSRAHVPDTLKIKGPEAFDAIGLPKASKWSRAQVVNPLGKKNGCRVLILGDSYAGHLSHGFADLVSSERGCEVHISKTRGCPSLFGSYKVYNIASGKEGPLQIGCRKQIEQWEKFVVAHGATYDHIILSSRWYPLFGVPVYGEKVVRRDAVLPIGLHWSTATELSDVQREEYFISALRYTAEVIRRSNAKSIIFSTQPDQLLDLRDFGTLTAYQKALPSKDVALRRFSKFQSLLDRSGVVDDQNTFYLDIFSGIFCPTHGNECINRMGQKSLYLDAGHLSEFGSAIVGEYYLQEIVSDVANASKSATSR